MKMEIGMTASFSKTVLDVDVYQFAGICGDFNPVHVNEVEASRSIFGKRIVHGMLVGSFISTVLGMYLPGPGTIYLSQNLEFFKPVYIGDTITAIVTVEKVLNLKKGIYCLKTDVRNQVADLVVGGTANVKYMEEKNEPAE